MHITKKKIEIRKGVILDIKVKIRFMIDFVYDNTHHTQLEELVLSLSDAKELVNHNIAVIDYIYD